MGISCDYRFARLEEAKTRKIRLKLPYFAVIFTSELSPDAQDYEAVAARMAELAARQPGFLGFDSVRGEDLPAEVHECYRRGGREAQARGRGEWYPRYRIRIAEVTEEYGLAPR